VADASKVDFRNPENFFHDVNSVAGLLKQFFRDLPDPLLTAEHYAEFIDAARTFHFCTILSCPVGASTKLLLILGVDDDIERRDRLHAIINSLPDPNYATLRALTLVSLSYPIPSHPISSTQIHLPSYTHALAKKAASKANKSNA